MLNEKNIIALNDADLAMVEGGKKWSKRKIAGVVTGIVGAIGAIAGGAYGIYRHASKNNKNIKEATKEEKNKMSFFNGEIEEVAAHTNPFDDDAYSAGAPKYFLPKGKVKTEVDAAPFFENFAAEIEE